MRRSTLISKVARLEGGHTTTICGGLAAGQQDVALFQKKMQTWTVAFFSSSQPTATAVGCSSPFEPFKDGFATGTEWREQTPPIFLDSGGSPAARGRGYAGRR